MSCATIRYRVRLLGAGAIHPGSGTGGVIDRRVQQEAGRPLVPGSHIRGIVRWELERISRALGIEVPDPFGATETHPQRVGDGLRGDDPVSRVFGAGDEDELAVFTDLAPATDAAGMGAIVGRARVSINRRLGTQAARKLHDLEVWEPGGDLAGECRVFAGDPREAAWRAGWLLVALRAVRGLGGSRSTGLGRCAIEIDSVTIDGRERPWEDLAAAALGEQEGAP